MTRLRRLAREYRQARLIRRSGAFDAAEYLRRNSDVAATGLDPVIHYLRHGATEGRRANRFFDESWYLEQNPDVAAAGLNPLVHFLTHGLRECRAPAAGTDLAPSPAPHPFRGSSGLTPPVHVRPGATPPAAGPRKDTAITFPSPHYEGEQFPRLETPATRLMAFYLPQFHPIPENDRWWGKGFTEWTNVVRASPFFSGHHQPHLPGELGFYDLRVPEVMGRQVELARQYGIHGFCFHYYWFDGTRLLDRPLDLFLSRRDWDVPFCLCWANENWTRRWDGQEHEILIAQRHSPEDDLACISDLVRYFRDPRYLRIDGRPLLIVYRADLLPTPQATVDRWRRLCLRAGVGEPFLVAAQTFGITDPRPYGFDAAVEFPPHGISAADITARVGGLAPHFRGTVYNYQTIASANRPPQPPWPQFLTVCPSWDNSARRGAAGHVFAGATPQAYARWLDRSIRHTREHNAPAYQYVFLNAWNEWAEGAHLEPDSAWGYAFLNATAAVLARHPLSPRPAPTPAPSHPLVSVVLPAYNHERYVTESLRSVLDQRVHGLRIELIVIDDGSADATADRAEAFLRANATLPWRLIRQPNAGAHAAINRGIAESRGEFISILNSDDGYHPDRIQTMYQALAGSEHALCFSDVDVIDAEGQPVDDRQPFVQALRHHAAQALAYPSLGYSLLTFNSAVSSGNLFFRRELFDRVGGFSALRYCHDWDFVLSALEFTEPVRVPRRLYRYRRHDHGTFLNAALARSDHEARLVLAKAAQRIASSLPSRAYPSLRESRPYLVDLLRALEHPLAAIEAARENPAPQPPPHPVPSTAGRRIDIDGPVVVYQMDPGGSRAVYRSLEALRLPMPIFHVPLLDPLDEAETHLRRPPAPPPASPGMIARGRALRHLIESDPTRRWYFIGLVRDPVACNVSRVLHGLEECDASTRARHDAGEMTARRVTQALVTRGRQASHTRSWFDTQVKGLLGIDVYATPFDTRSGYGIYRDGRFSLLVIRLEDLDACFEQAIRSYLHVPAVPLLVDPHGPDPWRGELDRQLQERSSLPDSYLDEVYSSRPARHFYTPGELAGFRRRWSGPARREHGQAPNPGLPPASRTPR